MFRSARASQGQLQLAALSKPAEFVAEIPAEEVEESVHLRLNTAAKMSKPGAMMDRGLSKVKEAVAADEDADYAKAFNDYKEAISILIIALKRRFFISMLFCPPL